jgi:microcystin-dependent protein
MPRSGGGIYSKGSPSAVSGTTIQSAAYNTTIDDLVTDANAARPISAGGTGAANAADARTNLGISATNTPFTPAGNIAASNVQAALAELDTEKAALAGATFTGGISGTTGTFSGVVSGANASADGHLLNRVTADGRYPPPGSIFWFAANAAPSGYLKANGALVSRSTYSALFAAIGTTFGVGDGSTTFALPDLRGEFVRGWDDGRGIDSGRAFGSAQAADFASHTHSTGEVGTGLNGSIATTGSTVGVVGDGANVTGSTGGTETRPRNIALLAIIKF